MIEKLVRAFLEMQNAVEMRNFLLGILTPKEIDELSRRLDIVKKLKQGQPHQQIAKQLQVGVATVTRGSRELQKGRFKYLRW